MSEESEQSLYDRIGGDEVITGMVSEFYTKVLADEDLRPFFKNVEIERLQTMQREFFSAALDGPINYSGRPLHTIHAGLGIKPRHMKAFVGHLLTTLEGYDLSERDTQDIISHINTYADEIMGGYGTGG
ncbi:MAG: hemoglobin [Pseudoalteromonas tetraodonis]|jgi:hemoglobin